MNLKKQKFDLAIASFMIPHSSVTMLSPSKVFFHRRAQRLSIPIWYALVLDLNSQVEEDWCKNALIQQCVVIVVLIELTSHADSKKCTKNAYFAPET